MSVILRFALAAALAMPVLAAPIGGGLAQPRPWPQERPIRWLVGFPPAGSADPMTRIIAAHLSRRLGQTIVVENRTGANQAIARQAVATADADGYTLLTTGGPALYTNPTPEVGRELAPVIFLTRQPLVLAGTVRRPTRDIAALLAAVRADPDDWSYGTAGVGSVHHIAGEYLNQRLSTRMLHVPYRGGSAALNDALGGAVPLILIGVGPVIAQVEAGTLRAYAVTTRERSPFLPNTPTFEELGVSGVDLAQTIGVLARAGTPREIIERLNTEINAVLREPEVVEQFNRLGASIVGGSVAEWERYYIDELATWTELARSLRIPIQ